MECNFKSNNPQELKEHFGKEHHNIKKVFGELKQVQNLFREILESQNREDETMWDQDVVIDDRSQYNISDHQSKDEAIIVTRSMNLPNINDSTNAETDCDTKIFDLHIVHITVAHNAETVAHTDHGNRIAEIATSNYVEVSDSCDHLLATPELETAGQIFVSSKIAPERGSLKQHIQRHSGFLGSSPMENLKQHID